MEKKNGIPLIILGLIGFFVASNMDTTVAAYDNERVFNIGLMNRQQNSIILSAISLIVGTLIQLFGKDNKKKESLDQVDYQGDRNTKNSNYQLFLTRKFSIEHNSTLNKYVINNDVFDNLDAALEKASSLYESQLQLQDELHQIEANTVVAQRERYKRMQMVLRKIPSQLYKRKLAIGLLAAIALSVFVVFQFISQRKERDNRRTMETYERIQELQSMFFTSNFFGYKLNELSLPRLTKAFGDIPDNNFEKNQRLTCRGSQCDSLIEREQYV